MDKSIVDKLGITEIKRYVISHEEKMIKDLYHLPTVSCSSPEVRELESLRDKMLGLIISAVFTCLQHHPVYYESMMKQEINIIEKATDKTWEQIKELL